MLDIGRGYNEVGISTAGLAVNQDLRAAEETSRQALEVRTREFLPLRWAQTHNNLARTSVYLEDWANAAASYANVLTVYPDAGEAYRTASDHLHETLFDFPQAFILNQQWLERHPEDHSAWRALAERPCTTGRFAEGEQRIAALLANPAVEPRVHIALQAIQIGAQYGCIRNRVLQLRA